MIEDMVTVAADYITSQSWKSMFALFWFTIIFDLPHYTLSFMAVAMAAMTRRKPEKTASDFNPTVSVLVAGHNEADAIERCVKAWGQQSQTPDEIIVVSDGSHDAMPARMRELQSRGLIDQAHCTQTRGGKSAGVNLAERFSTGEIVINVDCDCSVDRHALKNIVAPFEDPSVGGVSGNILVRNADASLVASFQAIEYLIAIALGKQASALSDHVVCVSGGFGAFRSEAMADVSGLDTPGGEDLDVTLRLRKAGWNIRFAADSICYTDVPASLSALVRQRFRWERDAIRLRYRKHADLIRPFSPYFSWKELVHETDFFVYNILGAAMLPFYIIWLVTTYGIMAPTVMIAAQSGLLVLDLLTFILAALMMPRLKTLSLLLFIPGYGVFNGLVMRFVRVSAYLQEWLFNASVNDSYSPHKVQMLRRW